MGLAWWVLVAFVAVGVAAWIRRWQLRTSIEFVDLGEGDTGCVGEQSGYCEEDCGVVHSQLCCVFEYRFI